MLSPIGRISGEPARHRFSVLWPTTWLALALVLTKAIHWSVPPPTAEGLRDYVRDVAASTSSDLAFVFGSALLAQAALWAVRKRPRAVALVFWPFVAFATLCVAYAVLSVRFFAYVRAPLTYPLWYLASDPRSLRASLGEFLPPQFIGALVSVPVAYICAVFATRLRPFPLRSRLARLVSVTLLLTWVVAGHLVQSSVWSDRDDHLIARSPHWELLASSLEVLARDHVPLLTRAEDALDVEDFEPPGRFVLGLPAGFAKGRRPTNVLLIVLESTAARWLSLYGSPYPTTPRLGAEAAAHAIVFDNFYCHAGRSANSMAALSLATYPYMTWREYTLEYPEFPGTTLAALLRARGVRTAYVHSGDLRYVGQDHFLAGRGFDVIWDHRDLEAEPETAAKERDDRQVLAGIFRFIDQAPGRPFYVMAWTIESHFPYEAGSDHKEVAFFEDHVPPDDYDLGRYLNAIHDVDQLLGRLFDGLRRRGLANDTLVVITADHGEAFGDPHAAWGHGASLYEEDVRIPLVIWNPRLIPRGRRSLIIGGHVDLNPTLAQIMDLRPDPSWQGRSLFDPGRPPRTYFYAANDGYLLGLREGHWKYIYNVTRGREELYDLAHDPNEQRNRADEEPGTCKRLLRHLAMWKEHGSLYLMRVREEMARRQAETQLSRDPTPLAPSAR